MNLTAFAFALAIVCCAGTASAQEPGAGERPPGAGPDVQERLSPQGATGQDAVTGSGGPGAGQGKRRANTVPDRPESASDKPPLTLDEAQRATIRAAVADEDTHQRTPAGFEPRVGAAISSAVKPHPLPRPLVYGMPVLKQYAYAKLDKAIAIIDPMSMKIVAVIPREEEAGTKKPLTPADWAATRGRELLGLPPESPAPETSGSNTGEAAGR